VTEQPALWFVTHPEAVLRAESALVALHEDRLGDLGRSWPPTSQIRQNHGSRSASSPASTTQGRHDLMSDTTMHHSPTCSRPGTTTTHGHSVDVVKCDECHAITTTRHGAIIETVVTNATP